MALPLRIAIIILQLTSIALLSTLLATPARKHPIVNTLVVVSLLRSICDVLPSLLYVAKFSEQFNHLAAHARLARFCIADSIALSYFTITKAAFTISFTVPCLYLACKFTRHRNQIDSNEASPSFYKRTIVALCLGPFAWGLPFVLVVLPRVVHHPLDLQPGFKSTVCTIKETPAQVTALILLLIPLALSVLVSLSLIIILWKYYPLPSFRQSALLLHPIRIARFVALVSTTMVSAALYTIVLTTWVKSRHSSMWGDCFETWQATSSTWEAISPLIYFIIFAAQEEVYTMWYRWLRRTMPCIRRRHSYTDSTASRSSKRGHTARRPSHVFAWLLSPCGGDAPMRGVHESLSNGAMPRSKGDVVSFPMAVEEQPVQDIPRPIIQRPFQTVGFNLGCAEPGLSPAPRSPRSRSQTPRESPAFRTMPSLTTLGGQIIRESRTRNPKHENSDDAEEVEESELPSQNSTLVSSDDSGPSTIHLSSGSMNPTGTFGR